MHCSYTRAAGVHWWQGCSPPIGNRSHTTSRSWKMSDVWRFQAGDALFLPEGWWHQVQSEGITIAVNFWWASDFEQKLGGHMDAYYLRRLVHSMLTSHTAASLATLCGEPAAAIVSGRPLRS